MVEIYHAPNVFPILFSSFPHETIEGLLKLSDPCGGHRLLEPLVKVAALLCHRRLYLAANRARVKTEHMCVCPFLLPVLLLLLILTFRPFI